MRHLAAVVISTLAISCAATPVPTIQTPTPERISKGPEYLINQFSDTCSEQATAYVHGIAIATTLFNNQEYAMADRMFDLRVDGTLDQLIKYEGCSVQDINVAREIRDDIQPLDDSIVCLSRFKEAFVMFQEAADAAEATEDAAELEVSVWEIQLAADVVGELIEGNYCRHLPENLQQSIANTQQRYQDTYNSIITILNQ